MAIIVHAQDEGSERVRPSVGTSGKLRQTSSAAAASLGEHLDAGHDWLYRRQTALVVPLSPVRIGFDSEWVHRKDGLDLLAKPEFEATLRLPNLEHRFRLFVTSSDLAESPGAPVAEPNPLRVGARFLPGSRVSNSGCRRIPRRRPSRR